jgi:hypothetical protein
MALVTLGMKSSHNSPTVFNTDVVRFCVEGGPCVEEGFNESVNLTLRAISMT